MGETFIDGKSCRDLRTIGTILAENEMVDFITLGMSTLRQNAELRLAELNVINSRVAQLEEATNKLVLVGTEQIKK